MGRFKIRLGDYREAEELLQESISIARRISDRWGIADGLETLGDCFQLQSKFDEAASALEESCLLWQQQSLPEFSEAVASTLVQLKRSQGDWDRALFWLDHIIASCRSRKDQMEVANSLIDKGRILESLHRYDEAALHFEAVIANCREGGYSWPLERAQLCAIPKTVMKWERRVPLLCDVKKLQRRLPQLTTASLKLPISIGHDQP
ncbi:hypothetical protein M407DRAFT_243666 [Tulasnella calospora MUT 4182]|uniref:Uncharacterized protein n=1 Tax=Tulasnella calospora MUT 4182 TaxID=1051891 RepID=A0A0C3Q992_9AGAM|nr:hypothetical protein M407DRAFT_243666 [Tulasnella calospora MUT 4182]